MIQVISKRVVKDIKSNVNMIQIILAKSFFFKNQQKKKKRKKKKNNIKLNKQKKLNNLYVKRNLIYHQFSLKYLYCIRKIITIPLVLRQVEKINNIL